MFFCMAVSDDCKIVASASLDSSVKIWNADEQRFIDLIGDTAWIKFSKITGNNEFLICSEDGNICVWDMKLGTERYG